MQYLRQAASAVTDALDSFNSARLYNYTGNRIFVTLLLWNHDSLEKNENGTVTLTEDAFDAMNAFMGNFGYTWSISYEDALVMWAKNLINPVNMDFAMMVPAFAEVLPDEGVEACLEQLQSDAAGDCAEAVTYMYEVVNAVFTYFGEADSDSSGKLDSDEFEAVWQRLVNEEVITAEQLEEMGHPDESGDGKVDLAEFFTWLNNALDIQETMNSLVAINA